MGEMVQLGGFEPPTSGSTDRRSNHLSYSCTGLGRRLHAPGERLETRSKPRSWQGPGATIARLVDAGVQKKSPGQAARAHIPTATADEAQPTFLKALVMLSFTGSAVSVITFWASAAKSLVCAVIVSNCLRACEVESSTSSE